MMCFEKRTSIWPAVGARWRTKLNRWNGKPWPQRNQYPVQPNRCPLSAVHWRDLGRRSKRLERSAPPWLGGSITGDLRSEAVTEHATNNKNDHCRSYHDVHGTPHHCPRRPAVALSSALQTFCDTKQAANCSSEQK